MRRGEVSTADMASKLGVSLRTMHNYLSAGVPERSRLRVAEAFGELLSDPAEKREQLFASDAVMIPLLRRNAAFRLALDGTSEKTLIYSQVPLMEQHRETAEWVVSQLELTAVKLVYVVLAKSPAELTLRQFIEYGRSQGRRKLRGEVHFLSLSRKLMLHDWFPFDQRREQLLTATRSAVGGGVCYSGHRMVEVAAQYASLFAPDTCGFIELPEKELHLIFATLDSIHLPNLRNGTTCEDMFSLRRIRNDRAFIESTVGID